MVAQADSNLRGQRLRQGGAGTSLLPGRAVYTMYGTLSLFLCSRILRPFRPGQARRSKPFFFSLPPMLSSSGYLGRRMTKRSDGLRKHCVLYQGTALEAAEKPCIGRESNASGAKARRILRHLRPD